MSQSSGQLNVKNVCTNDSARTRSNFELQSKFKIEDTRLTIDGYFVDRQFYSEEQAAKGLSRNINDNLQEYTPFRFSGDLKKGAKITFYESISERYEGGQ
jgi:hypothetical protein